MKILNRLTRKNPPFPPLRKGVIEKATSSLRSSGFLKPKNIPTPKTPFCKGGQGGFILLLLILLSSCKFSFAEDKLSQIATAFNLNKPQSERDARIIIQCDADTPTGVRSIRGLVTDYETNAVISNAFVSTQVSTEVYSTDAEGKFKIQKVGMETTRVTLKVVADTYKSLSTPIEFTCQNLNALIYLPKETIAGTNSASNPNNTPVTPTGTASTSLYFRYVYLWWL
jgi:hypothetical protein